MTRNFFDDPLNRNNNRNVNNTNKRMYNCGGYALNCFSWYCPIDDNEIDFSSSDAYGIFEGYRYQFRTPAEQIKILMDCVNAMLADFPDMRIIRQLSDAKSDEYIIAFRVSSYMNDFHFIKRAKNGHWYHKMGGSEYIDTMEQNEVLNGVAWCDRYDGDTVFFAKKNA